METSEDMEVNGSHKCEKTITVQSTTKMDIEQNINNSESSNNDSHGTDSPEQPKQSEIEKTFSSKNFSAADEDNSSQKGTNDKDISDGKSKTMIDRQAGVFKEPVLIAAPRILKKKTGKTAEAFRDLVEITNDKEKICDKTENKTGAYEVKRFKYATPAEQIKTQDIPIPYKEPSWGTLCTEDYSFEVIKNGIVIDTLDLRTKSFFVFGRLPSCDITMEHPSLSRYHAVVQYCGTESNNMHVGWYLYDLDSTHGTWVNKIKVKPRVYMRLRVGYVIKFGGSSRLNILQGPADDQEEESELSITEMKAQRERQKKEAELLRQAEFLEAENQKMFEEKAKQDTGCSWGMDDDAEDVSSQDLSATIIDPQNEDLYIEDPKKALRGYFEREGYELPEYDIVEEGRGKYKCRVELPIDTPTGEPIIAEVTISGKKKEAVAACALEACRILDQHGELRKATHESRAHKKKNLEENDFYESDEDTFLDRTGDIERKRKLRMKRAGKKNEKAETYESLVKKLSEIDKQVTEIEEKLQQAKDKTEAFEEQGLDVFDAYMMSLKAGALDTKTKMKLKRELFDLRQEHKRIEKLANIAKPALPKVSQSSTSKTGVKVLFGKMKGPAKGSSKLPKPQPKLIQQEEGKDEEFVEEEDEDDDVEASQVQSQTSGKQSISFIESKMEETISPPEHSNRPTKTKTIGPSLPPASTVTDDVTVAMDTGNKQPESKSLSLTVASDDICSSDVKQVIDPVETKVTSDSSKKKKAVKMEEIPVKTSEYSDMNTDPDYAVWIPPAGQTGDGKTHLNEKYGY